MRQPSQFHCPPIVEESDHLHHYLRYYQTLTKPGYAVLVTGEWGVGKTFQVLQSVPEQERYYVSLYGVQTVEQLQAEALAVAFPRQSWIKKLAEDFSDLISKLGGPFSAASAAPSLVNALLRREIQPNRTLIFDDLERSSLDLKDALGAINFYIEHIGFRVIVISHDAKLESDFRTLREKTFGHFVRAQPRTAAAFECFAGDVSDQAAKEFISRHSDLVVSLFEASNVNSLRIMRHVIHDMTRLCKILEPRHLENAAAMKELVQQFVVLDLETKASRLDRESLQNRSSAITRHLLSKHGKPDTLDSDPVQPPLIAAKERYPEVDLGRTLLADDVLTSMLCDGHFSKEALGRSLDNSAYFVKPEDAPPWKIVINFDELDDSVVEAAAAKMNQQFMDRGIADPGEMLHIFALMMMMAEYGISGQSIEDVATQCTSYIDDLRSTGRLPPSSTTHQLSSNFRDSFDGYGYWVTERARPCFDEVSVYLDSARERAFKDRLPGILRDLVDLLKTDPRQFLENVCPTSNGENKYALVPILNGIPAGDFVSTWMGLPIQDWRTIMYALEGRYEHGRIYSDLREEQDWAVDVHDALLQRSIDAKDFAAPRIKRIIPRVLRELADSRGAT